MAAGATKMIPSNQPSPMQLNAMAEAAILRQALEMKQPIFAQTFDPTKQVGPVTLNPNYVGLWKKFVIKVSATANNTDAADDATLSDLGVANLLTNVSFTDLNNFVRHQTFGWHLAQVYAQKHQFAYGAVILPEISGAGYGDNFSVIKAPATIAKGTSADVQFIYELPICYSDDDLRGAIYGNVINANATIALQINPAPFADKDVDSTLAVYKGASGALTDVKIEVYQVYLDQLPMGKNGVVLPQVDISTIYELKATAQKGLVAGQDFPISYTNFRDFLGTTVIYNSDPSADAGRTGGTDLNSFSLRAANLTNIFGPLPADIVASESRKLLGMDFPKGVYYFSSRRKPISTVTYGNMQLILNPKTAAAGAYVMVGWEDTGLANTLTGAGSLAGA